MPIKSRIFIGLLAALLPLAALASPSTAPRKTLKPFASDQELSAFLQSWAEQHRQRQERHRAPSAPQSMALGAAAEAARAAPALECATSRFGLCANTEMGAKSRIASKGRFL